MVLSSFLGLPLITNIHQKPIQDEKARIDGSLSPTRPQSVLGNLVQQPPKILRRAVIPHLMYPSKYGTFGDFPICKTEPAQCELGRKARVHLDEFFSRSRPTVPVERILQPRKHSNSSSSIPTIRLLLDVPDWAFTSTVSDWMAIRDPNNCWGVSCDARFGRFVAPNNTKVVFHPSRRSTGPEEYQQKSSSRGWKPHIYLRRLDIGDFQEHEMRALWEEEQIAFALESGESCGTTGCQYKRENMFANPATLLGAMTEGQVVSLVTNRTKILAVLRDQAPPRLEDFAEEPYFSGLFVSNCGDLLRKRWLEKLMDEIPIASFGGCPRRTPGKSCPRFRQRCTKVTESGKYPFAIAFENQPMLPGYLTEKAWEAFESNSLPVIWSSPDVDTFFPEHSFIDVRNFTSPTELAATLQRIRNDTALYDSYFAWRRNPEQMSRFEKQLSVVPSRGADFVCGMCHAYISEFVEPASQ